MLLGAGEGVRVPTRQRASPGRGAAVRCPGRYAAVPVWVAPTEARDSFVWWQNSRVALIRTNPHDLRRDISTV